MTERFHHFFEWLMTWEGETFEDDPADPGGATKFGIDSRSHPDVDIKNLTRQGAQQIYRIDYWMPLRCSEMPLPLDWIVCDIGVNNGRTRAAKWLQDAIGVAADGVLGPRTMAALKDCPVDKVRHVLLARREDFYRTIATGARAKFLKGWLNRNRSLREVTEPKA